MFRMLQTLRLVLALIVLAICLGSAQAQVDPSNLVRMETKTAKEVEKAWDIKLFTDKSFNCTARGNVNKFYIITDNEIYNRSQERLVTAISKSLLAFSYSSGPTRCIFRIGDPGNNNKFHVVVVFDEEVILDMPFQKAERHYFASQEEHQAFLKRLEANLKPATISRPAGEVEALTAGNTRRYFIKSSAYVDFHRTNTLDGAKLNLCATFDLPADSQLLEQLGATLKNIVKMDSLDALAEGLLSSSCDIIPSSDQLVEMIDEKIIKSRSSSRDDILQQRDKIYHLMNVAAAKGSDYRKVRWPREIAITGDPKKHLGAKDAFMARHKKCIDSLSRFGQRAFDCHCMAQKGLDRSKIRQCSTGYAYIHGKYKAFDYAKSFVDPPSSVSRLDHSLKVSECVAKKFEATFYKSVLSGKKGGKESAWYKSMLNKWMDPCEG